MIFHLTNFSTLVLCFFCGMSQHQSLAAQKLNNQSSAKDNVTVEINTTSSLASSFQQVKVKDPTTGKRFWLDYTDNSELLELRKQQFIILKTRRKRNPKQSSPWASILTNFIVSVSELGLRRLQKK